MNIITILPYKENYTKVGSGAVSLWVKDFKKFSNYKNKIEVIGNTNNKNYLTNNYTNIKLNYLKSKLISSTKEYVSKLIDYLKYKDFDIIEIHNRPNIFNLIENKIKEKKILYFHNDPLSMKGSKTLSERYELIEKTDKLIFISNWIKNKFFEGIPDIYKSKYSIVYHSINPPKKKLKKNKNIVFVGKLNKSKGFDLFCSAVSIILNKYPKWNAFSIGDEKRFQHFKNHPKHKLLGLMSNENVIKFLLKSEIAAVPSRWEEPFGRTSLEATSCGCATIISNRGGLPETTDNAIILKKLSVKNLVNIIDKLIKNSKLRKNIQLKTFGKVKHKLKESSLKIDKIRESLFPTFNIKLKKNYKIINIYNQGQKLNHRIYYMSVGKKFTNGFLRNDHDVLEISDRDYIKSNKIFGPVIAKRNFNNYLIESFKNYRPDLIFFGHSENINFETLLELKNINKNLVISQWNEDPVIKNLDDYDFNINKIYKYKNYVDHTFVTTSPDVLLDQGNKINNVHYFLIPVDKNIEYLNVSKNSPINDIFYAMSHGVNRATLKKGKEDERSLFLKKLIKKNVDMKYDFYGFNNIEPIWGKNFYDVLSNSKMGLNLSRGKPTKHYSSNRIATLIGNGLLTFIHKDTDFYDFFKKNELIFYQDIEDLADKIKFYKKNDNLRRQFASNGKKKYFNSYNNKIIAKYILDISFDKKNNLFK